MTSVGTIDEGTRSADEPRAAGLQWLPYAVALLTLGLTYLLLRPNMWLALQGDGAFYQSLAENGSASAQAGQDLAYFPQRLSLLVPERLTILLLGEHDGYLAFRWAIAAAATMLAVASVPRSARLTSSGLVGALCATTPPAIGWLSQNYPTLVTGLAIAGGAVACVKLLDARTAARVRGLWILLGLVAGLILHGHWGTAYFGLPVFVAGFVIMLDRTRRTRLVPAAVGLVTGTVVTLVVVSALGLLMFDVGTPGQIWEMNKRGIAQIANVEAAWAGFTDWGWVWWQTTLVLWGMAVVMPVVLRLRAGCWSPESLVLSGIVAGQLLLGALRHPISLGNTQYNPQIWPVALLALTHGVAVIAGTRTRTRMPEHAPGRRSLHVVAVAVCAVAGAWLGVEIGRASGLSPKESTLIAVAALGLASAAPSVVGRLRIRRAASVESIAAATGLVFVTFLVSAAQTIPPGVVSQGPSPAYPELSPQAWIDYTQALGPSASADAQRRLYLGAAAVSEAAYTSCPENTMVQYWTSAPSNGYLAWSVFAPYNTASTPYPVVPDSPSPVCLVAVGAPWSFDESAPVDAARASLLTEVPLRSTYHAPDLDDVVRVYVAPAREQTE